MVPDVMAAPVDLEALVRAIRAYPGVTRKHPIADVIGYLPRFAPGAMEPGAQGGRVLADFGEDCAVIALDDDPDGETILVAADGIMSTLLEANPWWAGYCSVLVNAMDVAATGGVPYCMVDVVSIKDRRTGRRLLEGVRAGVEKFRIPMVGGHTHPASEYNAIDVAIVGFARRRDVIYSHTARAGDSVVVAVDTEGRFHPDFRYSFDTTSKRTSEDAVARMLAARELSKRGLLTAGKDISNPGTLGTLGMLLETSGKGAVVDPLRVPAPPWADLTQWLLSYQGCGVVVTCRPTDVRKVLSGFRRRGLSAARIGDVNRGHRLDLETPGAKGRATLFDFSKEPLTGCGPPKGR